jgi:uncharacterized protein YecT (DUF1311 family)
MHVLKQRLFGITLTALSVNLHAAQDDYSATYNQCMEASDGVTLNMLNCISSEIAQHDARLNEAYQAAMANLSKEQQNQLRDVQRLWIKFRDADCSLLGSLTGGSIDRINSASCLLDATKNRANDLTRLSEPSL